MVEMVFDFYKTKLFSNFIPLHDLVIHETMLEKKTQK